MPYIIYAPRQPRSFVTNNPIIYMEARFWGWKVESQPYDDEYCYFVRKREQRRYETERRIQELERIWAEERERR
ncbi:hypothetical protein BU26DRAFT_394915, partial [Trematosphaeria pertusa]